MNYWSLRENYSEAINRDLIFKVKTEDLIVDDTLISLFENEEVCAKWIFNDYIQFLIWTNRNQKMTYQMFSGIYNYGILGTIPSKDSLTGLGIFFATNYYKNELYQKCFEQIIISLEIIFDDYNKGIYSKDVNHQRLESILEKIRENYLRETKNQKKSQRLLRRINKFREEIKTAANKNNIG